MEELNPVILTGHIQTSHVGTQKLRFIRYIKPLMVYGITIFSNAALSLEIFVLLAHNLTEVDHGIINLYNTFVILFMIFIGIGVLFVLNVGYLNIDKEGYRRQFTNALIISLTTFFCLSCFLLCFTIHRAIYQDEPLFAVGAFYTCLPAIVIYLFLAVFA